MTRAVCADRPSGASGRVLALAALAAATIALVLGVLLASSAQARDSYALEATFDFGGQFGASGPGMMALHEATDTLYVVDPSNDRILKFDVSDPVAPVAEDFSSLSQPAITQADGQALVLGASANIAVDNSGGPQDGTLYLATDTPTASRAYAFAASGLMLYPFAHADGSFSASGTPQTGRGIAVANNGPRAGEIVRLGATDSDMSLYTPAELPGEAPTIRVPQAPGAFGFAVDSVGGVGFSHDGARIQAVRSQGFFGAGSSFFDATSLTMLGGYNFGTWGTPVDVAVSYDGTLIARKTAGGSELARFQQVGASNFLSGASGTVLLDRFGANEGGTGLGMVESPRGYLYVADTTDGAVRVFGPEIAPDATMGEPDYVNPTTSTLRATIESHGLEVDACRFETGTTVAYGTNVPCQLQDSGDTLTATADVTVVAGSTYHSRVVVEADNQTTTFSDDLTWVAPDLPGATTLPAGPQSRRGTAVLGGTVHPHKTSTGYYVEYGTDPGLAGSQRFPADENADAGSGDAAKRVFQVVRDLQPATTYYFRVVAETKAGAVGGAILAFRTYAAPSQPQPESCANAAFRTGASAGLPDCRAWERVSPADKGGGQIAEGFVISASEGDRASFHAGAAFAGANGLGSYAPYVAQRGEDGWSTRSIAPAAANPIQTPSYSIMFEAFTPDLSSAGGVAPNVELPGAPRTNTAAYAWDAASGANAAIAVGGGLASGREVKKVLMAADGLTGALAGERLPVTSGLQVPTGQPAVYWWDRSAGISTVELASLRPDGTVDEGDAVAIQAVSADGQRVLWQSKTGDDIDLYLGRRGASTLRVTEASGVPQPTGDSNLQVAAFTEDLRYVYFTSTRSYTSDATAQPNVRDLYRFDAASGQLVDLTTADPNGGGVDNVLEVSDDGRTVYFFASGNLTVEASGSARKLYGIRDGVLRLIADAFQVSLDSSEVLSNGFVNPAQSVRGGYGTYAKISADGRYVLMAVDADLTPRLASVYHAGQRVLARYDWVEDRLDCVSCDPRGLELEANSYQGMPRIHRETGRYSGTGPVRHFMSDQGEVIFNSAHGYVEEDVNGKVDAYLWDGDLRLLTSGTADFDQWAQDASLDLRSIFVLSSEQLVPADDDSDVDLYVARVDGGLAAQQTRPVYGGGDQCEGDRCQGAGTAPPPAPPIASDQGGDDGNASPDLRKTLRIGSISRAALRRAARKGVLPVRVRTSRAGVVRVLARAWVGRRIRLVAGRKVRVRAAGVVTARLRLSRAAKRQLRSGRTLRVTLRVVSPGARTRTATVRLKRGARS